MPMGHNPNNFGSTCEVNHGSRRHHGGTLVENCAGSTAHPLAGLLAPVSTYDLDLEACCSCREEGAQAGNDKSIFTTVSFFFLF